MSECGYVGQPSEDGTLRKYSREECENAMGGLFHANGECTRPEGGSFSASCASVNDDPLDMLYRYRWWIGGAAVAGGIVYWRMSKRNRLA